jgi:ketosteroid isomerase-like protein
MPRENVEVVRRALEAAVRKPKPDFATVNALYDPDHELVTPISRLEGATLRGAEGFRTWLTGIGEGLGFMGGED